MDPNNSVIKGLWCNSLNANQHGNRQVWIFFFFFFFFLFFLCFFFFFFFFFFLFFVFSDKKIRLDISYTLQRRYYAVPYNAETILTRLVCGSFLCSFFPNFESFALFPRNSAVKKIVSLADLHILFYQSCHFFWLFQTQNRCHIFHSSTWWLIKV